MEIHEDDSKLPRVALSTIGTFHSFDLARQLELAGALAGIHTAYPRFKLRPGRIPAGKIHTFPWLHGPYMAGWIPGPMRKEWEYWDRVAFDAHTASTLPDCDVFCGLSGSALQTGRVARRRGSRHVCDRGSTHIRKQDSLLREEHERWGIAFGGIDPRIIAREEGEYAEADAILVPSAFVRRSFIECGIDAGKLHLVPYGVDLTQFSRVAEPRTSTLDLLFVGALSLRKGAHYLFEAYERVVHPAKSLTFAGTVSQALAGALRDFAGRNANIRLLGHVPQSELKGIMSRSHALVLPSIEEGLALVQAQAMACGCPVIASRNTGAEDLFTHGVEGFIVPPRDTDALAAAIQGLADNPELRARMAAAAEQRVANLGGWALYGQRALQVFRHLYRG